LPTTTTEAVIKTTIDNAVGAAFRVRVGRK
jgi:hypothetical protein